MAISRILAKRIESDAGSPSYWYVPHGQTVREENWDRIAEHLRVLAGFHTVPWEDAQPKYVAQLLRQRLIEPYKDHDEGFSAVGRMQLPVWRLLGLAWVNAEKAPEITEIGRRFVSAKSKGARQSLLQTQLHRYQFWNPSLPSHFGEFRTFPILSLYRLMSHCDWRLTWDEFLLFGTRTRSFRDADDLGDLIGDWRGLSDGERAQLLTVAQTIPAESHTKSEAGTTLVKVQNTQNYIRSALSILSSINEDDDGLAVPSQEQKRVRRIVMESAESAQFIDYESEQDWLAQYGQAPEDATRQPWTQATEARVYYESIGKIDAASEAFAKEQPRSGSSVHEYQRVQVLERVLEDVLEHNLEVVEKDLKLLDDGRQFRTAVGPIDLLARDRNGLYVIIELKRGRTSDRVIGQVARYITWVTQRLCSGKPDRVRAVVIGTDFDKHFAAAVKQLTSVSTYTFDLRIRCDPWPPKA